LCSHNLKQNIYQKEKTEKMAGKYIKKAGVRWRHPLFIGQTPEFISV